MTEFFVKNENGQARLHNISTGYYVRTIGRSGVKSCMCYEDMVVIVYEDGDCTYLYDVRGNYIRGIGDRYPQVAILSGNTVTISYMDGKTKVYDTRGNYIRQI